MRSCVSWGHADTVVREAAHLSDEDLGRDAHAIAAAARAAAITGRLCRLVETGAVFLFLRSYRARKSRLEACRVSGFSRDGVRQWMVAGRKGRDPFALFVAALARIDAARPVRVTAAVVSDLPTQEDSPIVTQTVSEGISQDVSAVMSVEASPAAAPAAVTAAPPALEPTSEQLTRWRARAASLQA